jgi:hypothetical protein
VTARSATMPMVSAYDGRACLGFILARGHAGFEAFTADDQSLGLFKTQAQAANALTDAAESERSAA